jgi:hypothetical protein
LFPPGPVNVTLAAGMTAPESSVMTPRTPPVAAVCEKAADAARTAINKSTAVVRNLNILFLIIVFG